MSDPQWSDVRRLFEAALEMPHSERRSWVESQDVPQAVKAEVSELLEHSQQLPSSFAATPVGLDFEPGLSVAPGELSLDGFELGELIGRGAMGVVYRAHQKSMGRDVAIKLLMRDEGSSEERHARFQREIRSAGKLDSPSIARVYVDGEFKGVPWFAMELVEGHSLSEEIGHQLRREHGKCLLPAQGTREYWTAVVELIADVAGALELAHAQGVIHRDIKPSNLLLSREGQVKIIDFGVARDTASGTLTSSGQLIGSLPYMSPEQARIVRGEVDGRSDIYSLGSVLYELATLRKPHGGASALDLLHSIEFDAPAHIGQICESCPEDVATICERAMEKSVLHRFQGAEEFSAECRLFLGDEPLSIKKAPIARRWWRSLKRRRAAIALVATAALAVVLGWRLLMAPEVNDKTATLTLEGVSSGDVSLRYLSEATGVPGDPVPLGTISDGPWNVEPGFAHVVLRTVESTSTGAPVREFLRRFRPYKGVRIDIQPDLAPAKEHVEALRRAMVEFEGGTLGGKIEARFARYPSLLVLHGRETVVEPFAIDPTEVSVGAYRRFVDRHPNIDWPVELHFLEQRTEFDDRPMTFVSWVDARDYAEWVGLRLPTRAEWLYAATDQGARSYPWGESKTLRGNVVESLPDILELANGLSGEMALERLVRVDSAEDAMTPEGLYHMFGNASEWMGGPFIKREGDEPVVVPDLRVLSGGAWALAPQEGMNLFNTVERAGANVGNRSCHRGFRCARSLEP